MIVYMERNKYVLVQHITILVLGVPCKIRVFQIIEPQIRLNIVDNMFPYVSQVVYYTKYALLIQLDKY